MHNKILIKNVTHWLCGVISVCDTRNITIKVNICMKLNYFKNILCVNYLNFKNILIRGNFGVRYQIYKDIYNGITVAMSN